MIKDADDWAEKMNVYHEPIPELSERSRAVLEYFKKGGTVKVLPPAPETPALGVGAYLNFDELSDDFEELPNP